MIEIIEISDGEYNYFYNITEKAIAIFGSSVSAAWQRIGIAFKGDSPFNPHDRFKGAMQRVKNSSIIDTEDHPALLVFKDGHKVFICDDVISPTEMTVPQ